MYKFVIITLTLPLVSISSLCRYQNINAKTFLPPVNRNYFINTINHGLSPHNQHHINPNN